MQVNLSVLCGADGPQGPLASPGASRPPATGQSADFGFTAQQGEPGKQQSAPGAQQSRPAVATAVVGTAAGFAFTAQQDEPAPQHGEPGKQQSSVGAAPAASQQGEPGKQQSAPGAQQERTVANEPAVATTAASRAAEIFTNMGMSPGSFSSEKPGVSKGRVMDAPR
jgi:hypothetical protein